MYTPVSNVPCAQFEWRICRWARWQPLLASGSCTRCSSTPTRIADSRTCTRVRYRRQRQTARTRAGIAACRVTHCCPRGHRLRVRGPTTGTHSSGSRRSCTSSALCSRIWFVFFAHAAYGHTRDLFTATHVLNMLCSVFSIKLYLLNCDQVISLHTFLYLCLNSVRTSMYTYEFAYVCTQVYSYTCRIWQKQTGTRVCRSFSTGSSTRRAPKRRVALAMVGLRGSERHTASRSSTCSARRSLLALHTCSARASGSSVSA